MKNWLAGLNRNRDAKKDRFAMSTSIEMAESLSYADDSKRERDRDREVYEEDFDDDDIDAPVNGK